MDEENPWGPEISCLLLPKDKLYPSFKPLVWEEGATMGMAAL